MNQNDDNDSDYTFKEPNPWIEKVLKKNSEKMKELKVAEAAELSENILEEEEEETDLQENLNISKDYLYLDTTASNEQLTNKAVGLIAKLSSKSNPC